MCCRKQRGFVTHGRASLVPHGPNRMGDGTDHRVESSMRRAAALNEGGGGGVGEPVGSTHVADALRVEAPQVAAR